MANGDISSGDLVKNLLISILILALILAVLPAIFYGIAFKNKRNTAITALIRNYKISSQDHDTFNTLEEIYLFCSYIPIRRVRVCENTDTAVDTDVEATNLYNKHLNEVYNIVEILTDLYDKCKIGGEKSKRDATDAIEREREKRELREHEEKLANQKEAGENNRFRSTMFLAWTSFIFYSLGPFLQHIGKAFAWVAEFAVKVIQIITPIIQALASNRVFVGFIILVILVSIIFGLLKPKDKAKAKKRRASGEEEDDPFGLKALYEEMMDTYEYYKDMINNFKLSSISGGLIPPEEENVADGEDGNGLVIKRKTINGKSYDNLSYIMLSDVFTEKEIEEYFGKGVKIDRGKYYNIYLPEEKFKSSMNAINWKVNDAAKQNEKVWRIDCEKLDTLNKKAVDGEPATPTFPAIPAFIKDGNKCVINARGLDRINKPPPDVDEDIQFKTEFIR